MSRFLGVCAFNKILVKFIWNWCTSSFMPELQTSCRACSSQSFCETSHCARVLTICIKMCWHEQIWGVCPYKFRLVLTVSRWNLFDSSLSGIVPENASCQICRLLAMRVHWALLSPILLPNYTESLQRKSPNIIFASKAQQQVLWHIWY